MLCLLFMQARVLKFNKPKREEKNTFGLINGSCRIPLRWLRILGHLYT